jgi:hypothetical protein
MVQLTILNRFSQILSIASAVTSPNAPTTERLTIQEKQHHTLPAEVTSVRVLSGTAWVSHLGKNTPLYRGQKMQLQPERDITIITPAGFKPVQLELIQ